MKKKKYIAPVCVAVNATVCQMLASSGYAPDSNDTEFGAPTQQRGEWGDLWEDKGE